MHCVVRVSPRRKSWCLPAVKKAAQGLLHTSNTATIRSDHNHSCCVWPFFPRSLTCCSQIFIFLSSLLDTVSFLLCIYSCLKYIDIGTRVFWYRRMYFAFFFFFNLLSFIYPPTFEPNISRTHHGKSQSRTFLGEQLWKPLLIAKEFWKY